MSSEPEWTKRFSNDNVCNYYYYLSVAIMIIGSINLFVLVYILMALKASTQRTLLTFTLIGELIVLTLVYFIYLFLYLMCTRSLNK